MIVGKYGETLVVDWGLAKSVSRADPGSAPDERTLVPSSSSSLAETLPGSALGTPAYMSPEQAAGELDRLGPRSDVYRLGATLYCLLTGRPPFLGDDAGMILRQVQRGEFPSPRALDPALDRALEAVCLKAMPPRPEDRYASPRALAEDVERWTADEPVAAWREPLGRRACRWAWRNRTPVTAAAVAVVVAAAGLLAVSVVQVEANRRLVGANSRLETALAREERANEALRAANDREHAARERAQRRFGLARRAVEQFHTGGSADVLLNEPHVRALRATLVAAARAFYAQLQAELEGDDDPSSRAELAAAYEGFALTTDAAGSSREALAAYERLSAEHPEVDSYRDAQDEVLLYTGVNNRIAGRPAAALQSFERSLAMTERLAADRPGVVRYRTRVGVIHNQFSIAYARLGRPAESLQSAGRALERFERLTSEHPDIVPLQSQFALSLGHVGSMHQALGHRDAARRALERSCLLLENHPQPEPVDLYNLACYRAHLAVLADIGAVGPLSQGRDLGHQEAEAAMTALRRAIAAGYKNLADMIRDPDLDPLRSRSDFQLLMMDLAMPAVPFAR